MGHSDSTQSTSISDYLAGEIDRINSSRLQPVVFIHGLWLLSSSWDRWINRFEEAGYAAFAPGWPDDPSSVALANERPEVFASKSIGMVADHYDQIIRRIARKPILIGHSFGGLLVSILAGRGLAATTIALAPAPFRGVLPLPLSALRAAWPVLRNPANRNKAVTLSFEQFQYAFANAVDKNEARELYERFAVPAPGAPIFQAATANLNPWTEASINLSCPDRGPLLIIAAEQDHTVPWSVCNAAFKLHARNAAPTEIIKVSGHGHAITIDGTWLEVAEIALKFAARFATTQSQKLTV